MQGQVVDWILANLLEMSNWIDELPLRTDPQRFGNLTFRDWGKRLEEVSFFLPPCQLGKSMTQRAASMHERILARCPPDLAPELLHHFKTSFGSFTRIDYGTGHELAFFAYLCLLVSCGAMPSSDDTLRLLVSRVYVQYLHLCLKLQKVYRLEPAGSKGVWGLDDFQFLSYLFGSSQLLDINAPPRISSIAQHVAQTDPRAQSNLFFLSLSHVHALKSGPFYEHSPVLYNISQTVPSWAKVHKGLEKMYAKEVLEKWPVVQHFYFGRYLSWTDAGTGKDLPVNLAASEARQETDTSAFAGTKAPWAI
jgi:serine/threonine-protein phosphatase 2A activator